jgi:DNA repair protein RadC
MDSLRTRRPSLTTLTPARHHANIRQIAEGAGLTVRDLGALASVALADTRAVVRGPEDAASLCPDMAHEDQEVLTVLVLDTRNRLVERVNLYRGNVNASIVRTAEVFRRAIILNAPSILVLHNHPSGDPCPSPEDVALTRTLNEAGRILDIALLDHVVIASTGYVSLRGRGLGF